MKNSKTVKTILFISGLIGILIGGAILFVPVEFFATNGLDLSNNRSLLNEIRPPGGALLASGVLIMLGAFLPKLTFTSIIISILLYFAYGLSRLLSIAIDGLPDQGLLIAMGIEILLGFLGVFALMKYRENEEAIERFISTQN